MGSGVAAAENADNEASALCDLQQSMSMPCKPGTEGSETGREQAQALRSDAFDRQHYRTPADSLTAAAEEHLSLSVCKAP
jgi:hypothetical protein